MNTINSKPSSQRNVTPNFLKYRRKPTTMQANPRASPTVWKTKGWNPNTQLIVVLPKQVVAVLMSIRREFFISAKLVFVGLL